MEETGSDGETRFQKVLSKEQPKAPAGQACTPVGLLATSGIPHPTMPSVLVVRWQLEGQSSRPPQRSMRTTNKKPTMGWKQEGREDLSRGFTLASTSTSCRRPLPAPGSL